MQDLLPLAGRLGATLKARGDTVGVAESSAGGLVSAALLSVPGASAFFVGGGVIYTVRARVALLGIAADGMPPGVRSASEPYALLLARTARERLGATWGLAETGAAGPDGNRHGDAPGHACIAVSGPAERAATVETGHGDRAANMRAFALALLGLLAETLDAQAGGAG